MEGSSLGAKDGTSLGLLDDGAPDGLRLGTIEGTTLGEEDSQLSSAVRLILSYATASSKRSEFKFWVCSSMENDPLTKLLAGISRTTVNT